MHGCVTQNVCHLSSKQMKNQTRCQAQDGVQCLASGHMHVRHFLMQTALNLGMRLRFERDVMHSSEWASRPVKHQQQPLHCFSMQDVKRPCTGTQAQQELNAA